MTVKLLLLGLAATVGASVLLYSLMQQDQRSENAFDAALQFHLFRQRFNKTYASESEVAFRQRTFADTLSRIAAHNAQPHISYILGVNRFSDMTIEEKRATYFAKLTIANGDAQCTKLIPKENQPSVGNNEVDWVKAGKVQRVKDQQQCVSDWAFATSGALESAYAIFKNIKVPNISEQELVDCSFDNGNFGCNGGIISFAFDYILNYKVNTEALYPYIGNDQDCKDEFSGKGLYAIKDCVQVSPNVEGLIAAIGQQPVAIAFNAQDDFFDYSSGVYNPSSCQGLPNRFVLAVGYKLDADIPYLRAKNSWGRAWGESGYFNIAIGQGAGTCNIAGSGLNYYPVV